MLSAVAYQWNATKSTLHLPAQAVKNCDSQSVPISGFVPAPLVTAGEPICTPFPARGFIYLMWVAAAVCGSMFACVDRSGSLKDRRCEEPEAIAAFAAASQPEVCWRPKSIGTYSAPETIVPRGALSQLYAQLIPLPAKAL